MKKFLISVVNALPELWEIAMRIVTVIDKLRIPEKNNGSDDKE